MKVIKFLFNWTQIFFRRVRDRYHNGEPLLNAILLTCEEMEFEIDEERRRLDEERKHW